VALRPFGYLSVMASKEKGQEQKRVNSLMDSLNDIGERYHIRPTSIFGWDDPKDWYRRLLFDLYIVNNTRKESNSSN
jgi:hypothetical protein